MTKPIALGTMEAAAPLFDPVFYAARRPDLAGSDDDLLRHYVNHGWREGSAPHALFDPLWAVRQAGAAWPADTEPFGVWQQGGWQLQIPPHPLFDRPGLTPYLPPGDPLAGWARSGRSPHPLFDRAHYLAQSSAIPPGMDPFTHYSAFGHRLGLVPHRLFSPAYVLQQRPDIGDGEPLAHYAQGGADADLHPHPLVAPAHVRAQAGAAVEPVTYLITSDPALSPHPLFDPTWYLRGAGPVAVEVGELPLLHYLDHDAPADPCWLFDEAGYRARTGVRGPGLVYYLTTGWRDGMAPHPLFDSAGYGPVANHLAPLAHYACEGERNGRRPNRLFSPAFYRAVYRAVTPVAPGAVDPEQHPFQHYVLLGEAAGRAASPEFRARRYASRFMAGVGGSPMAHALVHRYGVPPAPPGPRAPAIAAARGGTGPVGAAIVRLGPGDPEAQRALPGDVTLPDLAALRDWAMTAAGPVVLLHGAAFMALADLQRLVAGGLCHPVMLDRAGDVRSAGVTLGGGLARPRGTGADLAEPALNAVVRVRTTGPVLALPSPDALRSIDCDQSWAAAFLALSAEAILLPGAQATDLAATLGGPDPAPVLCSTLPPRPALRALLIDSIVPRMGFDAGSYYALQLMAMLQSFGYAVTLVPDAEMAAPPDVVRVVTDRGVMVQQTPFAPTAAAYIAATPDEYAVILLSRFTSGGRHLAAVRARWPAARIVFHPGDLHYLREQRAATLTNDPDALAAAAVTRTQELAMVAGSDMTVVVSAAELALLQAEGLGDRAVQVDPEYANRPPAPYDAAQRHGVAFIGGFGHAPNVDAVRWLCTEIWPRVTAARPDLVLHVVGSAPPPEFSRYASPSVQIRGRVDDLDGLLDTLRLTIAPLRFGAGVKMKLITSLAAGVPAIVTPIAVEGTGLEPSVVVADDAPAFAAAILGTYDDLGHLQTLSDTGIASVQERFSAGTIHARYRTATGV